MKAEIISIGNELLIGDTVNTNASWLGQALSEHGVEVVGVHTIGDDLDRVTQRIRESMEQADLVISTGGLGPTHDDITKKALLQLFDAELVVDDPTLEYIKKIFKKRNIPFTKSNYHQAEVLSNAEVLFNTQGTAPGMWFDAFGCRLAVLPGVPFEMKHLMQEKVLPRIDRLIPEKEQRDSRYILTAGIGESTLSDDVIGELDSFLRNGVTLAYLPGPHGTRIRVSSFGRNEDEIREKTQPLVDHIYKKAGMLVIGEGRDLTLSEAVGQVLRDRGLTIATAESCTGGLLSSTLTDIPGSSDYVVGGVLAYADRAKIAELEVSKRDIAEYGAVSKQVALQMARNVARKFDTDIGISTTGIAGPGGGTEEKPVGTVWIGYWSSEDHFALKTLFSKKHRSVNKERSVGLALETVRRAVIHFGTMPYGLEPHRV